MKRILSFVIVLALLMCFVPTSFAASLSSAQIIGYRYAEDLASIKNINLCKEVITNSKTWDVKATDKVCFGIIVRTMGNCTSSCRKDGIPIPSGELLYEGVLQNFYSGTTVTGWDKLYVIEIDPELSQTIFGVVARDLVSPATFAFFDSVTVNWIDYTKTAAPPSPTLNYNDPDYHEQAVIMGLDTTMEYKNRDDAFWTPYTGSKVAADIPSNDPNNLVNLPQAYFVRYKAFGGTPASNTTQVVVPKRSAMSSVTYDTTTESFTGLTSAMEARLDNGIYLPVSNAWLLKDLSSVIDSIPNDQTATITARLAATAKTAPSTTRTFILYSRLQKPTTLQFSPITYILSGTDNTMQYRVVGAASWTSISGATVDLGKLIQRNVTTVIEVRRKPTTTNAASLAVELTLPMLTPAPSGLTVDYFNETITGCTSGKVYQHSVNGTSWTNVTASDGFFSITSLITTSARTIYVREAATATAPYTDYVEVNIPARTATPTSSNVKFDGFTETILVNDSLEYRIGSTGNFTPVPTGATSIPANVGTSSQSYQIRVKATDTTFASATLSVTVPARAAAPSAVYNASTDKITGVSTAMEYSLDNGATWTSCTTTTIARSAFGDVAKTVKVRTKATATAPISNVKDVAVPDAPATSPTGLVLDEYTETIFDASYLMESIGQ